MTINEKSTIEKGSYTFTEVVDEACCKLKDKQIKNTIQRIQAMEYHLQDIEKELDEFLEKRNL